MTKRFDVDDISLLMNSRENVRNLTVIAHVDHGKSTLTDSLVRMAGISSKERFTDATPEEQQRGISIEACGVTLPFELPPNIPPPPSSSGSRFLFNLIDSPGHVDFSSEVTTALRLTDGALVVVDAVEGVCVQTETVLRQALMERIKPVLVINKIDRLILELKLKPEEMYQKLNRVIEDVNVLISTYSTEAQFESLRLAPTKGNICFASAILGWGFTLQSFSRLLAEKLPNVDMVKFREKLWGDYFYDNAKDKWVKEASNGVERGFCRFILKPFISVLNALSNDENEKAQKLLQNLNVKLSSEEWTLPKKNLIKLSMARLSHLGAALVEMVVLHLPSPLTSQKYKIECCYEGNCSEEDPIYKSMTSCDDKGELMIYISKMIKNSDNRFVGFGRIFSGTAKVGQKISILYRDDLGKKQLVENKNIKKLMICMGRYFENIDNVSCGNIICVDGIDTYVTKSGTLTSLIPGRSDDGGKEVIYGFKEMTFAVSPVVKAAVKPKKTAEITKLVEGLKKLAKADSCVEVKFEETGENVIGCAGELHLEVLLKKLKEFSGNIEIIVSEPVVSFNETVIGASATCLAKSANKHNRLFMTAKPNSEVMIEDIENNKLDVRIFKNVKAIQNKNEIVTKYDLPELKKVWAFGPDDEDMANGNLSNILIDSTRSTQYLNETRDSIVQGFKWATKLGVLCEEKLRGVRLEIIDATLHSDAVHRGMNQILPASRRVINASQVSAQPRLVEPWYIVEIQCDQSCSGSVYNVLQGRRGRVETEEQREGTPLWIYKGVIPVVESFGFTEELRSATKGKAFPQCSFSHWETYSPDPLDPGSDGYKLMMKVRERKGLPKIIPSLSDFQDTL